jgi:hypothetical protein
LIRKVLSRTVNQPIQNSTQIKLASAGVETFQTIESIGRHSDMRIISAALAMST